jgi:indolepyruvate ferredoxin oxidoreductase beta subunit
VDATSEAVRIGNAKVTNVIMLGAFSALLDVDRAIWEDVVLARVPDALADLNRCAFRKGCFLIDEGKAI